MATDRNIHFADDEGRMAYLHGRGSHAHPAYFDSDMREAFALAWWRECDDHNELQCAGYANPFQRD